MHYFALIGTEIQLSLYSSDTGFCEIFLQLLQPNQVLIILINFVSLIDVVVSPLTSIPREFNNK